MPSASTVTTSPATRRPSAWMRRPRHARLPSLEAQRHVERRPACDSAA
jgi:hypothetical protein